MSCIAHARHKFDELHVTRQSQVDEQALLLIEKLYTIEAEPGKQTNGTAEHRCEYRNNMVNR